MSFLVLDSLEPFDLMPSSENTVQNFSGGIGINHLNNSGTLYQYDNQHRQKEIEQLKLIIQHKDEIILQKDKENQTLQKLLDKLTEKFAD